MVHFKVVMKKFRFVIAAALSLCIMQGVWAIAPGGTLGGGGKAAQRHPASEDKTIVEPSTAAAPAMDAALLDLAPDVLVTKPTTTVKKSPIGKQGAEGQSNSGIGAEEFAAATQALEVEKAMRLRLKSAIAQYRAVHASEAPASPVDGSLLWLALLPMLLPPLTVYLKMGSATSEFWISVLLTPMLLVPGFAYAMYVVLTN